MSAAARALALRGSALRPRLVVVPRHASEFVMSRVGTSALVRSAPGSVVTFAGVQGGAGVSTVTLLACGAVTRASEHPAVAIDLAAGTRGGLGGLAGAWSQTSAEATAELVIAGGRLARPYTQTQDGVHIISAEPQAAVAIDQTARKLLARDRRGRRAPRDRQRARRPRARLRQRRGDRRVRRRQPGDSTGGAAQARPRGARTPQPRRHRPRSRRRASCSLGTRSSAICTYGSWQRAATISRSRADACSAMRSSPIASSCSRGCPMANAVGARGLRSLGEARGCPVARLARFDRAARGLTASGRAVRVWRRCAGSWLEPPAVVDTRAPGPRAHDRRCRVRGRRDRHRAGRGAKRVGARAGVVAVADRR